jgi:hypothetical protein
VVAAGRVTRAADAKQGWEGSGRDREKRGSRSPQRNSHQGTRPKPGMQSPSDVVAVAKTSPTWPVVSSTIGSHTQLPPTFTVETPGRRPVHNRHNKGGVERQVTLDYTHRVVVALLLLFVRDGGGAGLLLLLPLLNGGAQDGAGQQVPSRLARRQGSTLQGGLGVLVQGVALALGGTCSGPPHQTNVSTACTGAAVRWARRGAGGECLRGRARLVTYCRCPCGTETPWRSSTCGTRGRAWRRRCGAGSSRTRSTDCTRRRRTAGSGAVA